MAQMQEACCGQTSAVWHIKGHQLIHVHGNIMVPNEHRWGGVDAAEVGKQQQGPKKHQPPSLPASLKWKEAHCFVSCGVVVWSKTGHFPSFLGPSASSIVWTVLI